MNGSEALPPWFGVLFFVIFFGVFGPAFWAMAHILRRMGFSGWWVGSKADRLASRIGLADWRLWEL